MGQVAGGANGLAAGAGQLVGGANELAGGAQGVAAGAQGLASGLTTYQNELAAQAAQTLGMVDQAAAAAAQGAYENAMAQYTQAFIGEYTTLYTQAYAENLAAGMDVQDAMKAAVQTASIAAMGKPAVAAAQASLQTALEDLVTVNAANAGYGASSQALSGAASGGTTRITAPVSGTYSAVADGYESVLTPEALETMTPSQLSSTAPQSVSTTVGKLIQGSAWYFAANVNEEDAASLKENSRLTLRMASGVGFDLPVTLTRISAAENGKCLIVLKSTRYLSYMTLLREQNAELIISAYDGLRVPKNALRVDENGVSGVYCLVGRVAYFKPVSIVYQGSDYCLVEPGTIEAATESQKSLYTLRPNDEVIVSAGELYNGKVVD